MSIQVSQREVQNHNNYEQEFLFCIYYTPNFAEKQ